MAGRKAATGLGTAPTSSATRTSMKTRRSSFLRRHVALLGAILTALASFPLAIKPLTVSADMSGCVQSNGSYTCRYTQLQNNGWPQSTSDPDCHDQCAWYLHGSSSSPNPQTYGYRDAITVMNTQGVDFKGWMVGASDAWSGQPFNSPSFYNCECGSGEFLTLGNLQQYYPGTTTWNTTSCGFGGVTTAWEAGGQTYDNHIVSSFADYNDQYPMSQWVDETLPADGQKHCSAAYTAYHEVGHGFGEGHASSSPKSEVMFHAMWNGQDTGSSTDKIDGDAQQLLSNLYGAYTNSSNNGGSGGCNGCQMACPQVQSITTADGIQTVNQALWTVCGESYTLPYAWGYYAKMWDILQSAEQPPNVPTPTVMGIYGLAFGNGCATYFQYKQLVAWLNCQYPIQ